MKVKRKARQPLNSQPLFGRSGRKAEKVGNWYKRLSTFVMANAFSYYNKFVTWRHSLMDGLP